MNTDYPEKIYIQPYGLQHNSVDIDDDGQVHCDVSIELWNNEMVEYTRSDLVPKWHKVADGDLPKENEIVVVKTIYDEYFVGTYMCGYWAEYNNDDVLEVIEWKLV